VSAGRKPARSVLETAAFILFTLALAAAVFVPPLRSVGFWAVPIVVLAYLGAMSCLIASCGLAWRPVRIPLSGPFIHLTPTENLSTIVRADGLVHLRTGRNSSRPLIWPPVNQPKSLLFLFVGNPAERHVRNNFTEKQIQSGLAAVTIEHLPADARVLRRRFDKAVAIAFDYTGPAAIARYVSCETTHRQ
jgi:hypothetical protein